MRTELETLVKYCEWQIAEGKDYHPTLPSAVAKAKEALTPKTHDSNEGPCQTIGEALEIIHNRRISL